MNQASARNLFLNKTNNHSASHSATPTTSPCFMPFSPPPSLSSSDRRGCCSYGRGSNREVLAIELRRGRVALFPLPDLDKVGFPSRAATCAGTDEAVSSSYGWGLGGNEYELSPENTPVVGAVSGRGGGEVILLEIEPVAA